MEWLEKLKGLISAKVHDLIKFESHSDSHDDNRKVEINTNGGNINVINIPTDQNGKVSPEALEALRSIIIPAFEEDEVLFLKEESTQLLQGYRNFTHDPNISNLLDFFKGKINETDLRLLETGLYEKHLIETDDVSKAQQIKKDVMSVHGVRGKNILNLASGGYFETHIKPLYEALAQESNEGQFKQEYEKIISDLPFTIFVHSGLGSESVLKLLDDKVKQNIQYGVKEETIIINGFGQNADLIEGLIPNLMKEYKKVAPSVTYLGNLKTIKVAVYYREKNTATT